MAGFDQALKYLKDHSWTPTQIELLSDDWQLCDATGTVVAE